MPAPDALPGTTWKFSEFYMTFVSDADVVVHDGDPESVIAEGTFRFVDGFIEVAMNNRVRAGSWDGAQLMIDGMIGRFAGYRDPDTAE